MNLRTLDFASLIAKYKQLTKHRIELQNFFKLNNILIYIKCCQRKYETQFDFNLNTKIGDQRSVIIISGTIS